MILIIIDEMDLLTEVADWDFPHMGANLKKVSVFLYQLGAWLGLGMQILAITDCHVLLRPKNRQNYWKIKY